MAGEKEKIVGSQKYFINKFSEYIDPFQRSIFYKALQEKRYDSLILIFNECLDIQKDWKSSNRDNTRLKASLKSSLKGISFYCQCNPLSQFSSLARDLQYLIQEINKTLELKETHEQDIRLFSICTSISILSKRLTSEKIISLYVDMLLNEPFSHKQVDLIVQYIVSELIYQGYSLKYLNEWYIENIKKFKKPSDLVDEDFEVMLENFRGLAQKNIKYYIILNSWLPLSLKEELDREKCININYQYCLVDEGINKLLEEKKKQLNYKEASQYFNLIVEVNSYDKYKAIEKVVKSLENYLEMFKYIYDFGKGAINLNCLISTDKETWEQVRTDETDNFIFMKSIGEREKDDIKDFLNLRNKVRITEGSINLPSISLLNRSLEMIKSSFDHSPENRLLNIWSALEYTLNSYDGLSIINKVLDIVPKVICLYVIKDKMNILWERLCKYRKSKFYIEVDIIEELFNLCSEESNGKYNKDKFVDFLSIEDKIFSLYKCFGHDAVMMRDIAMIRELLKGENTKGIIEEISGAIEHDLTRIYRVRNKLVHSGNRIPYNIDIYTIRLYNYVNSLIGTLIHYIKREPELNIEEIIYSIHKTYNYYINSISTSSVKKDLAFPPYLYL
ncbi:hypothetical protein CN906_30545 [Bacillus toyonensis]|uniref:hypothetical protein n=2 Tax=Bacillus cereus group TaxID=86661 RepID=UPI000BF0ECFB|nr:hypothetical protein [Bacillus toyonensis]PEJ58029.1 hypothetical protein CN906_30545 [Bacillus toyonensis]